MKFVYFLLLLPFLIIPSAYADFELVAENRNPVGLTWDPINERFAVLDNADNLIYMYGINGLPLTAQNISVADLVWDDIDFYNSQYHLTHDLSHTTDVYNLDGTEGEVVDRLVFFGNGAVSLTFGPNRYYDLDVTTDTVFSYELPSGRLLPLESVVVPTHLPDVHANGLQYVDGYFFISFPDTNEIFSFNRDGVLVPSQDVFTEAVNPHGLLFFDNDLLIVENHFVHTYEVHTNLDNITDLSGVSHTADSITLSWTAPLIQETITGYQINYTYPFSNNPDTIVIDSTGNTATGVTITNLDIGVNYSFGVAARTASMIGAVSNILNFTTLHNLEIGNIDATETNPERVGININSEEIGDDTIVTVKYTNTWNLVCFYQGSFAMNNSTIPIVTSPFSSTQHQAKMVFRDATNDVITITCRDTLSDGEGKYVITQREFLLQEQVAGFRDGTFGTFGQIGGLDLVVLVIIIICMIAFNRVNESVGIVVSLFVLGIATYFKLITLEFVLIPIVILVVIFAIATTRKT